MKIKITISNINFIFEFGDKVIEWEGVTYTYRVLKLVSLANVNNLQTKNKPQFT